MIKKLILTIALCLGLLTPASALADASGQANLGAACTGKAAQSSTCKELQNQVTDKTANPVATTIQKVANIMAIIISVIAVFMMIISGITYITSQGNSDAVTQSRNRIIYAMVGLVITASAWAITSFFTNNLG